MTHPMNMVRGDLAHGCAAPEEQARAAEMIEGLHRSNQMLSTRVSELEKGLRAHRHTQECFEYAANTARKHGNAHCIAICADAWREMGVADG